MSAESDHLLRTLRSFVGSALRQGVHGYRADFLNETLNKLSSHTAELEAKVDEFAKQILYLTHTYKKELEFAHPGFEPRAGMTSVWCKACAEYHDDPQHCPVLVRIRAEFGGN